MPKSFVRRFYFDRGPIYRTLRALIITRRTLRGYRSKEKAKTPKVRAQTFKPLKLRQQQNKCPNCRRQPQNGCYNSFAIGIKHIKQKILYSKADEVNTTATAQINVRLDKELKEAGDSALAELGLTPSVAVRALWEQAARRGEAMQTIAPLLMGDALTLKLLVCTDVWLALVSDGPSQSDAAALLAQAANTGAQLLYPATALSDIYHALGGEAAQKAAWAGVDRVRKLGVAVGVDEADLMLACRYRGLAGDLAGNMALAAAERAKADYLVTFDDELLRRSTVAALSPKDMCVVLQARS